MMADLLEIERASTDPALVSFTKDGVERLHHADAEIAGRNHKEDAVLEALDVISGVVELLQQ